MKDEIIVTFLLGYVFGRVSSKYGGVEQTFQKLLRLVIDLYNIFCNPKARSLGNQLESVESESEFESETARELFKPVVEELRRRHKSTSSKVSLVHT